MADKAKSTLTHFLLGTAIGDAFGAGVEFQDRRWIRQHVDFSRLVNARADIAVSPERKAIFTKNYRPWDYTDDTEMTVGLIKALCSGEPFDEDLLVRKWLEEYQLGEQQKGVGRHGHGSMAWFFEGSKTIDEVRDFQRHRPNPGNAPAMRAAALGFLPEAQLDACAATNANATHPNPVAVQSSQCVTRAAHFLLQKHGDPSQVLAYCLDTLPLDTEYQTYLQAVDQLPAYEHLSDADWAVLCGPQPIVEPYFLPGICGLPSDSKYTAGCVLLVLKNSRSAFEALVQSVRVGGDVDSLASIATGIWAARDGLGSLPAFMLEQVEGVDYLSEVAEAFAAFLKQ